MASFKPAIYPIEPTRPTNNINVWATLKSARRKWVTGLGKHVVFAVDHFLARQSLVSNAPVLDTALFEWVRDFEENWQAVRDELTEVLKRRADLPRFQDISPDQMRISPDDKWRTFFLYGFGHRADRNCQLCPQTAQLLGRVPGIETAFFSILAPGKIVPPHRGITKGLIRCHLGLIVPADPELCFMDVGGIRRTWQEGKVLMFDDTYLHAVSNIGDQERVVLLFDIPRPMRLPGRVVRALMFWLLRRTGYVQDAMRNEARWEQRYHSTA